MGVVKKKAAITFINISDAGILHPHINNVNNDIDIIDNIANFID